MLELGWKYPMLLKVDILLELLAKIKLQFILNAY